jgi:vacuolar-type H+-ATPase subunit C/Vma6
MNVELITAGTIIVGALGITFYVVKSVLPLTPYLYSGTLLMSRSAKYLSKQKLEVLAESKTIVDVANSLSGTYFSFDSTNLTDIHTIVEQKYVDVVKEVLQHTPNEFNEVLSRLMMLHEGSLIKYLYKTKFNNKTTLVVGPSLHFSREFYERCTVVDFAEFKALFSGSIYWQVLKKEYSSIIDFERAFDEFVYAQLSESLPKKLADRVELKSILQMIIDNRNILACIQGIVRGEVPIYISRGIKPKASTFEELEKELAKTQYKDVFERSYKKYAEIGFKAFDIEFEKEVYEFAKRKMYLKPQGALAVFTLLLRAQIDKKNVQLITKCVDAKLPSEQTKQMLIYV